MKRDTPPPIVKTCPDCGRGFTSNYAAKNHVCKGPQ